LWRRIFIYGSFFSRKIISEDWATSSTVGLIAFPKPSFLKVFKFKGLEVSSFNSLLVLFTGLALVLRWSVLWQCVEPAWVSALVVASAVLWSCSGSCFELAPAKNVRHLSV
jgi:hypothetical protein